LTPTKIQATIQNENKGEITTSKTMIALDGK
jgi:hypothetical protein